MSIPEPLSDGSNYALGRLRTFLEAGTFDGDQRLPPERILAAQIGISRRALRRGLEVLEAEGRIWRQQGKGTFLGTRPAEPTGSLEELSKRTHPLEVMDVRLEIEPALARLASLRASNGDIERLRRLAEKTALSTDADARELWDNALHRAIAETAGNSLLLVIFDMVDRIRQDTAWRLLRKRARSCDRQQVYVEQHRRVIAAIARREAHVAEQAMREHLELVRNGLLKVMTSPEPDHIQGDIPRPTVPANTEKELQHGT